MNSPSSLFGCLLVGLAAAACSESNPSAPPAKVLCDPIASGDIAVTNQTDLDALAAVTHVKGDLLFCSNVTFTNLVLPELTQVDGNLLFFRDSSLALIDLPKLTSLGDNGNPNRSWHGLIIAENDSLSSVNLPLLSSIDSHVWLNGNIALTHIDMPSLSYVTGAITFKATHLTSIDGFSGLRSTGSSLLFTENATLTSIAGFDHLFTVSDDIGCNGNPLLESFSLPTVRSVGRILSVTGNPLLAALDLSGVVTVGDGAAIEDSGLTDLSGISSLAIIGTDLSIQNNAALKDAAIPLLSSVGRTATIQDNPTLTAIALGLLSYIGQDLTLNGNAALSGIDISLLGALGGDLSIIGNAALPTCTAESLRDAIGTANIGGTVAIAGNDDTGVCGGTTP